MAGGLWHRFEELAQQRANSVAFIHGGCEVTFGELRELAESSSAVLLHHGVSGGSRCLFWAENSPEFAAYVLATWRLGGIVAFVNDEAPNSHLAHAATVTQPVIALVDPARAPDALDIVCCPVIALNGERAISPDVQSPLAVAGQEPASILFTSGSTGRPKGVAQSHENLQAGCAMVAKQLGLTSEDRILCSIPWSFDYGYGQLLTTLLFGITQVLPSSRNPFAICNAIADHCPSIFVGLPSLFASLLRGVSPFRETDLSSVRLVTNTGGKIAPALFADITSAFAHSEISLNYGMTETYRTAGLHPGLALSHPDSVGKAYPGVAIAVVREDGSEAAIGELGEIVHRGVGVFLGYWGDPEATARVRRPDPLWNHADLPAPMAVFSGDLGWIGEDGLLYIKGRRDRLIKSMGVRVSPDEIERILRSSGLVRDATVIGVPHEILGEMVVAVVAPTGSAEGLVARLKQFARDAMSPQMLPRQYYVMDEVPLTPNGKTDFGALMTILENPR